MFSYSFSSLLCWSANSCCQLCIPTVSIPLFQCVFVIYEYRHSLRIWSQPSEIQCQIVTHLSWFRKMGVGLNSVDIFLVTLLSVNLVKPVSCSGHFLLWPISCLLENIHRVETEAYWQSKTIQENNFRNLIWLPFSCTLSGILRSTSYCQILDFRQKLCSELFKDFNYSLTPISTVYFRPG